MSAPGEARVSVVLCAAGDSAIRFRRTLLGVLEQDLPGVQLLAAGEADFLARELAAFPGVERLPSQPGTGLSAMRNLALSRLAGDLCIFVRPGSTWQKGMLAAMVSALDARPGAAALCANASLRLSDHPRLTYGLAFHRPPRDAGELASSLAMRFSSQVLYRTQALSAAGAFDEAFEQLGDLDLGLRLPPGSLAYLEDVLFDTDLAAQEGYSEAVYREGKLLMQKHEDLFLVKRSAARAFMLHQSRLALRLTRFPQALLYLLRALAKRPLYSLYRGACAGLLGAWQGGRVLALLGFSLLSALSFAQRVLRGKPPAPAPAPLPPLEGNGIFKPMARAFSRALPFGYALRRDLRRVELPAGIKRVRLGMFFGCPNLEEVVFGQALESVKPLSFALCPRLRALTFHPLTGECALGAASFLGARSLEGLSLPPDTRRLGAFAFAGCAELRFASSAQGGTRAGDQPALGGLLSDIGAYTFAGCEGLTQLLLREGSLVTRIHRGTFLYCRGLQMAELGAPLVSMGAQAFRGCERLAYLSIKYLDNITRIGPAAFRGCAALGKVDLPQPLTRVRRRTWEDCRSVKAVRIPRLVKTVEHRAFAGCISLDKVILLNSFTQVDDAAFPPRAEVDVFHPGEEYT